MNIIDRRSFVAAVLALSGMSGLANLYSYAGEITRFTNVSVFRPGRFFTAKELTLLGDVADTIIPDTDTPGAVAVGVHGYIDGLMVDWASAETRASFRNTLSGLATRLTALTGKPFADCTAEERFVALKQFDEVALGEEWFEQEGYRELKHLIMSAYYNSEIGTTIELRYQQNPGDWRPCIPFERVGRNWADSYLG